METGLSKQAVGFATSVFLGAFCNKELVNKHKKGGKHQEKKKLASTLAEKFFFVVYMQFGEKKLL